MALDAIITAEKHGNLPDNLKTEYKKREDGTYLLEVTGSNGFALENVTGLKSALSKEREAKEKAEAKIAAFKDLDPEKARDALAKVAEMDGWDKDEKTKQLVEAETKKLIEKHNGETAKLTAREKTLLNALTGALIDSEATAAIAEQKGNVDLLAPIVRRYAKLEENDDGFKVRVVDDDGTNRITLQTGKTDPMGIREFVNDVLRKDERYQAAFGGSGSTGGGAKSGGGGDDKPGAGGEKPAGDAGGRLNPVEKLRQARKSAAAAASENE